MQLVSLFSSKNVFSPGSPLARPDSVPKFDFTAYVKAHPEIQKISTAGRAFIELTGVHPNEASQSDLPAKQFLQETRAIKKSSEAPSFSQLDAILKNIPSLNRYAVIQQALTIARKTPSSHSPQLIEHLEKQLKGLKPTQYRSAEELKGTEARTPLWQKALIGFAVLSAIGALRTFTAPTTIQPDFKPPLPLPEKSPNPHFASHNPFRVSEPLTTHNPFNPSSYPLSLPRELACPSSDATALAPVPNRPFSFCAKTGQAAAHQATSLAKREETCPPRRVENFAMQPAQSTLEKHPFSTAHGIDPKICSKPFIAQRDLNEIKGGNPLVIPFIALGLMLVYVVVRSNKNFHALMDLVGQSIQTNKELLDLIKKNKKEGDQYKEKYQIATVLLLSKITDFGYVSVNNALKSQLNPTRWIGTDASPPQAVHIPTAEKLTERVKRGEFAEFDAIYNPLDKKAYFPQANLGKIASYIYEFNVPALMPPEPERQESSVLLYPFDSPPDNPVAGSNNAFPIPIWKPGATNETNAPFPQPEFPTNETNAPFPQPEFPKEVAQDQNPINTDRMDWLRKGKWDHDKEDVQLTFPNAGLEKPEEQKT